MNENTKSALQLLNKESTGILSTHSIELEGYPFGSVTPYCLDKNFNPIILVSDLAQHTKNINADNKVSLTIAEEASESEKQSLGRLTYIGDAFRIESETEDYKEISQIYLRYFPAAKHYFEAHNFYFYRIKCKRARYIEGFGKIFWIEKKDWDMENIFTEEEQNRMISHMNVDHQEALRNYCSHFKGITIPEDDILNMVGIYQLGFDLIYKKQKYHFKFEDEVKDSTTAREALVAMAKESKA